MDGDLAGGGAGRGRRDEDTGVRAEVEFRGEEEGSEVFGEAVEGDDVGSIE